MLLLRRLRNQSYENEAVRARLSVYPRTDARAVTLSPQHSPPVRTN